MIAKIKNRIIYKRNLKFLKMYTVNTITGFILHKADVVNAIQKIMLAVNDTENTDELKVLFNSLVDAISANNELQKKDKE